ncbi:hypothetical protein O6H91_11G073400 [Diphasiastrum complanatum]|uniref:Uncharacterized protein n=1 Tax=Diphasiastrum complanatum TaxID=34168 RepID=A0ACC2CAL8_DIPCM|nr:hypothetical protein O6H91_11G073400 [Diphasiastrum complanatum]
MQLFFCAGRGVRLEDESEEEDWSQSEDTVRRTSEGGLREGARLRLQSSGTRMCRAMRAARCWHMVYRPYVMGTKNSHRRTCDLFKGKSRDFTYYSMMATSIPAVLRRRRGHTFYSHLYFGQVLRM